MRFFVFFSSFFLPLTMWSNALPNEQIIEVKKIFASSPFIYLLLAVMSIGSMALWLHTLLIVRLKEIMPESFKIELRLLLEKKEWDKALEICKKEASLLSHIVKAGLLTRNLGASVMMDAMKNEGKRASTTFWQRFTLLNDIAVVAPMMGLLGTVIGMFYAFYATNRSVESINALFDGLGISVGTTVAGLIVAILAMIFATTMKYRLIKTFTQVENEAVSLSLLIPRS